MKRRLSLASWAACLALAAASCPTRLAASDNMIERQSQNEGILVLPAPAGGVTIDGDLSEWDLSGRIWCFADESLRSTFSVQVSAMWDQENLYVAGQWKDATPMYSTVDPEFNPNDGWKSDSMQLRIRTKDQIAHVTTWYYSPRKEPVVQVSYGVVTDKTTAPFGGDSFWVGKAGATVLGRGIELAYKMDADGKGYTQELKIPWSLLSKQVPKVKAGDTFQLGMEFLWGDVSGKTWPIHRYADNMQPGKTSREFYFTAYQNWGDATIMDHGHVPVRAYSGDDAKIAGTIPIRFTIPKNAARFTLVIEDAHGRRVRNLAADCDPGTYATPQQAGDMLAAEVLWDGRDDLGKAVEPGTYHLRGLTQRGITAVYDSYYYNPGSPPWQTADGSGAWGADHSGPISVASAGEWVVLACPTVEGGSGVWGLDGSGTKRWGGEKRSITYVAADGAYVYGVVEHRPAAGDLCRFALADGSYHPFERDGKLRPFDLAISDIFDGHPPGSVAAIAAAGGRIALAMSGGTIAILDGSSATLLKRIELPQPTAIAFGRSGTLFAISAGHLVSIASDGSGATPFDTPGVGVAGAIACAGDGAVLVADIGPDSDVKAFSSTGKLLFTCGKTGGRPIRGAFDEQAMMHVSSVAVDAKNQIWVTENWNYPRRVSVWGRDGRLVRDYIGNTGYSGTDCYLHDSDPSLAFCGPMEFHRHAGAPGGWKLAEIMWHPDPAKGESFALHTDSNIMPERFTSSVSGSAHEYLYLHERDAQVLFIKGDQGWRPCAAIAKGSFFGVAVPGTPDHVIYWTDTNRDGKVQIDECQDSGASYSLENGWGGRIAPDLTMYMTGLARVRPDAVASDGVPVYSPAGRKVMGIHDTGDLIPVTDEHKLLLLSYKGYAGRTTGVVGIDTDTDQILWTYPLLYPGVHGSHDAPMPSPGLLIGPLKICGVAHIDGAVGNVFAMRGNLGQDFFMTTDGLYVGALFRDGRLPSVDFPATVAQLAGTPMNNFTEGGEPFNGWFAKQADGAVRLTTGMAREAGMVLTISGLDTIQRFDGGDIMLDAAALAAAVQGPDNAQPGAASGPKSYTLQKVDRPPVLDASAGGWTDIPGIRIARQGSAEMALVRLAYDQANLYLRFEVTDPTPWRNTGKDFTRLFKSGDAVDLQIGSGHATGHDPRPGDVRLVIANYNGKPTAVLMSPGGSGAPLTYTSPVMSKQFGCVTILMNALVAERTSDHGYIVDAAIRWQDLQLSPESGRSFSGDVGFISSDASGTSNTARTYWSNRRTNLVNDLPSEAWFDPSSWGTFTLR